jgi:two-component system, cell cycle response regulator DivK
MTARILILDDNEPSLEIVRYLLEQSGYDVLTAADGEQGLALALRERPEVVLCDLQMPVLNGYEVLRQMRKRDGAHRTIVIAVTAYSMPGDRQAVLQAGFDGYFPKPIEAETFVQQIEALMPAALRAQRGG